MNISNTAAGRCASGENKKGQEKASFLTAFFHVFLMPMYFTEETAFGRRDKLQKRVQGPCDCRGVQGLGDALPYAIGGIKGHC